MDVSLVSSIALGTFGGITAYGLSKFVLMTTIQAIGRLLSRSFSVGEIARIRAILGVFVIWISSTILLTLDFRSSFEVIQYAVILASLLSTFVALGVIQFNFGASSEFGRWRDRKPEFTSPEEHHRRGVSGDLQASLWTLLGLAVGINSAIVAGRLVAFKFEGHWFPWLLS